MCHAAPPVFSRTGVFANRQHVRNSHRRDTGTFTFTLHPNVHFKWGLRAQSYCQMPPADRTVRPTRRPSRPQSQGACSLSTHHKGPQYHALSRPNIFAHTHAIGHVRLLSNFHVVRCSQAVRSLNCAHRNTTARSELQLGGGAPPCVSEGLLGLLIEAVEVKAAHTQMARRQVAKSSRERQWQDMRGRSAPLQHMQRAGMQSRGAQRAASHKCGGRERERK